MRLSRTFAIITMMTAIAAPLGASAATNYNISIPLRLSGMPPAMYQFQCALGSATVVPPTRLNAAIDFQITGTTYSGMATFSVQSATAEHSYRCILFQLFPSQLNFNSTPVQVSETM
jgi:phage tail tape-measure protein